MSRSVLLFTVFALVAAGCVAPNDGVDALDTPAKSTTLPYLDISPESHDHKDRAQHDVAWNMEMLGWDPIAPDASKFGRYNHVNLHGDHAFVTAYALEKDGPPGLAIFDITENKPRLIATLATPDVTPIDVHVSEDGKYAILAGHRDDRVTTPGEANQCFGAPVGNLDVCTPFVPGGVLLVDVSEPAAPTLVDRWTSPPSGGHTAKIYGRTVYVASYGFSYASRTASGVEILEVTETPMGAKLTPVTRFLASDASGNDGAKRTFVHDMVVEKHPNGRDLMYVSYWDGGVVIVDVTNPARPREIAKWHDFDIDQYGNIHYARPIGMIGDRHITIAAPEFSAAEHAGEAYVLDTTDPTQPTLLARWTIPGNPINDGGYRFSPHNFDPSGTKIVYAHYHGGIWVLDLATPEAPVIQGYAFPTVPSDVPDFEATEDAPNVWAAVWADDGTIYASDIGTGLYHYRLVSDAPGAAPIAS